jgi:hypothetical protein
MINFVKLILIKSEFYSNAFVKLNFVKSETNIYKKHL